MTEHSPEWVQAEIRRLNAEALKFEAETQQINLEADEVRAHLVEVRAAALVAANNAATSNMKFQREMAADKYHHKYRYTSGITEASVKPCIDELTLWHRLSPGCDMEIVFDSPGGSVIDGMDLFDFLQEMREKGHFVTTSTRGYAASMGGILLQAGDKRVMGREAYVLIHEVAAGVHGKIAEIKDEVAFIDLMSKRILNVFASRSAEAFGNGTSDVALTVEQFRDGDHEIEGCIGWDRTDWWLDSDDCLRFGIVDEVR
jgi:ATP-dependent protease ClpP protease subunit